MDSVAEIVKRHLLLVALLVILASVSVAAYVNSPSILSWLNPSDRISVVNVSYPSEIYRSQNLPITVTLSNSGADSKNALVEIISRDEPIPKSQTWLEGPVSNASTTLWLPITSYGAQAFTIKVSWIGPGGFCKLEQESIDRSFTGLAADYATSTMPKFASRAQEFDWTITIQNMGNTPANLTVQISKKDPLIISSTDAQQIANIQIGETRTLSYHFIVPSTAALGDCKITVNFVTSYPETAYCRDPEETISRDYVITIQESPVKTQIDNVGFFLGAMVMVSVSAAAVLTILRKRR